MFLNKDTIKEIPFLAGISIYAFYVTWTSGNIGIIPIDSFGFLDTGHSILNGKLPIRDFWIFTGLLVDYMSALFLAVFGNNWNSYLIHSSFMNIFAVFVFYIFLRSFDVKKRYAIFYCLSFATLCYPVSGTPFAYIHAYIFSLVSIMVLMLAIKNKNKILWFFFPVICFFSFLSMQTPTVYILFILFFVLLHHFLITKEYRNFKFFLLGCFFSFTLFLFFMIITGTPFKNFWFQYILFPLTIGEGRLSSSDNAYVTFLDQMNIKRLFGDFKFIHIFLFPLILIMFDRLKKKEGYLNIFNITIVLSIFAFLFNQLLTANQIYIFSLIPILAATVHININDLKYNSKFLILIILILLFVTTKFHFRYNIERKFHDLENVDKTKAVDAKNIHQNLKNLKWISKLDEPNNEIKILNNAIKIINEDKRNISLITHYQFISTVLDKNLNILNRWYLWDDNTHPTENHKYFNVYKSLVNRNINSNNIEVIYLLGQENEIVFDNMKNYFTDLCFESKTLVEKRFSVHEVKNCK